MEDNEYLEFTETFSETLVGQVLASIMIPPSKFSKEDLETLSHYGINPELATMFDLNIAKLTDKEDVPEEDRKAVYRHIRSMILEAALYDLTQTLFGSEGAMDILLKLDAEHEKGSKE